MIDQGAEQTFYDPITGEVVELAEIAARLAAGEAAADIQRRDLDDARAVLDETQAELAELRALLLSVMSPGDRITSPDGSEVICVRGPRRNRTVNREAAEAHLETLLDLGLVERVPTPPPPPRYRWKGVAAFDAAEEDLARRDLRVNELTSAGGFHDPVLKVNPAKGRTP